MLCSTVIPTIGRPTLSRAVHSVLEQEVIQQGTEVIVVNDSGKPLAYQAWMDSPRVRILDTNRRERSVARNVGATVAKGSYLHFLDDDDWMLPGAFDVLSRVACKGRAGLTYGGFRLVNNEGQLLKEIRPADVGNCLIQMVASEWIPLQASWIDAGAFISTGGFASLYSLGGGYEDIDLCRRIARYHDFSGTQQAVACIRYGDRDSTTNYANFTNQNRQSREKSLGEAGSFARMRLSARANPVDASYWHGQIIYYYLASLKWNAERRRILTAASRCLYSGLALALAVRHLLSPSFWRGVTEPHVNLVRSSLGEMGASLYSNTVWRA